ncbi:MAG: heparinase II/III-family protein, partial [Acetatifactor sp.]|nr:heparinase II/III-family protein [Acetatifactor sp.]
LSRSDTLALAVKAGDNADNHNHNDTRSFTLYKNGQPVFVDIGVESYTQKTFSERRYEIWTMQSGYHNLPTLMGLDQRDGSQYRAMDVSTCCGDDMASISMELLTAYPIPPSPEADVPFYRRSVTLDKKRETVTLKDITSLPDVILNFITYEKPSLDQGHLRIGSLADISFTGACPLTDSSAIEVLPITDERLKKAWNHDLYRVRLRMTGNEFTMEIR